MQKLASSDKHFKADHHKNASMSNYELPETNEFIKSLSKGKKDTKNQMEKTQ